MARIVLTTFGSLGDLHPYIAVGRRLLARGHQVTIATSQFYREKVEGEGLGFYPLRPDLIEVIRDPATIKKAFHARKGSEFIVRGVMLPALDDTYDDLLPLAAQADLLVSHPIAYATPIAAEKLGKPWISVVLFPTSMLSAYDPPAVSGVPVFDHLRRFGPGLWRLIWSLSRTVLRSWGKSINRKRRELGLREVRNPLLDDMFSPYGSQAWFSPVFAEPQPDWPSNLTITGFPVYDKLHADHTLAPELERFLSDGPPPIVFTLGSSAVFHAGSFYNESAKAALALKRRAILLTGLDPKNQPTEPLPPGVIHAAYAPYSELFPRVAAVVHQGGVGTTAQVLRAGVPACFVPFSFDQPENARRCVRLGTARVIPRHKYNAARATSELGELLGNPTYATAARNVAVRMANEDGIKAACDAIEQTLREHMPV